MIEVTSILIRELRERTGAGIMDCKRVLTEVNGNIELAIENMRKSGVIKAAKKAMHTAADGLVLTKTDENYGIILEVNCQTDFVAKDEFFQRFVNRILNTAFIEKISDIDVLKNRFNKECIDLINKIGENIIIRRVSAIENKYSDSTIGFYQHGTRIGVLITARRATKKLVKHLAMHIAASKPEFIRPEDISSDIIKKEYQVQLDIALQTSKSREIAEKIVEDRIKNFTNEVSLINQVFIIDPSKCVGQLLKEQDVDVVHFVRYELGENIQNINYSLKKDVDLLLNKN